MALPDPPRRGESSGSQSHDAVLQKLAKTNTFDSDWASLRSHLHQSLNGVTQVFVDRGPPRTTVRPPSPPVPGPSVSPSVSTTNPDDKPPPESLLLSPSTPTIPLDPLTPSNPTTAEPRSVDVEPSRSPTDTLNDNPSSELDPSTPGGLIIAPFPPLDPTRRRRSPSTIPSPRINGHARANANPMEDEWDEDIVIGGKKLVGWMDQEEAKREVERVGRILDNLDYAPFTIQRIAELLLEPTAMHSTLGKFLRAIEKALLVNTPWETPSYTYIPSQTRIGNGAFSNLGSTSSASSDAGSDEDSLMPPGSMTPMFSPIPFLRQDELGEPIPMDIDGQEPGNRSLEDGLMSPLNLEGAHGNGTDGSFRFGDAPGVRSPTPEPDDMQDNSPTKSSPPSKDSTSPTAFSASTIMPAGSSDPGHQSYLGRVDELDTGPLNATIPQNGSKTDGRDEEIVTPGTGEGGNMTPHGMSDKPVPLSSTTVVNEEERRIAGMPKGTSE